MNSYILVKTVDLTQGMQNRTVQPYNPKLVNIGDPAVEYHLLEIPRDEIVLTAIFDGCIWYTAEDAKYIKDNGALP